MHLFCPLIADLFHRSVLMSGSSLSPDALVSPSDASEVAAQVAEQLDCDTKNTASLLQCLRQKSVQELLGVKVGCILVDELNIQSIAFN